VITLRPAAERGHADHGWLETRHSFSFAGYQDPEHMGFRALRVLNEDRVQPRRGFGTHGHRNMEILTWVLAGALEHRDSLENGSVIRHGDLQRMSAGTGVMHSEFNHSASEPVHFLQMWLLPESLGLAPSYEQANFPIAQRHNRLCLIASPDGADGSLTLHQDANLLTAVLDPGQKVSLPLPAGRHAWVQVARGDLALNGLALRAGDGAAVSEEQDLVVSAREPSEILVFDLA
jgi:redox-sensitive bicupin YhaK (pirin superfamily)